MVEFVVMAAVVGAGTIWWLASTREYDAASVKLRKQQADKRARFARTEVADEADRKPKAKSRSFGNR